MSVVHSPMKFISCLSTLFADDKVAFKEVSLSYNVCCMFILSIYFPGCLFGLFISSVP